MAASWTGTSKAQTNVLKLPHKRKLYHDWPNYNEQFLFKCKTFTKVFDILTLIKGMPYNLLFACLPYNRMTLFIY